MVEHGGDIYYKCGEPEKAVEFWKEALKLAEEATDENDKREAKELNLLKKKIKNKRYYEK